jgi:hypothetical protein
VLEPARPVREAALAGGHVPYLVRDRVEDPHPGDGLGHLLAVRAHVLNRRGAGRAGNAGQALDSGEALGHRECHDVVPGLAGLDRHQHVVALGHDTDAGGADQYDRPRNALISDNDVAAPGQHEERLAGRPDLPYCFDDFVRVNADHQARRRTTEPERRVSCQVCTSNVGHGTEPRQTRLGQGGRTRGEQNTRHQGLLDDRPAYRRCGIPEHGR